ncbi:efflux RND transporter periplasmic adaptor subunit [Comamonas aquatica]|jgi:RND family efflux transporter MFP subunit|uniref:efflux RND transporter periplasmic adaptor subunit n=1 Tax=Comamonas aquatica TaxID=225991 RepID=UPI0021B0F44A|nr:efflux RND transporter periplasmic adaptor subunit [Comamonas aquatica]
MVSTLRLRPSLGLCVVALVALTLSACSRQAPAPEPVRAVKLLEVGASPLQTRVEYAGDVRAQTESRLGFQVAGKLVRRAVNVGDVVRQGQVLAEIDGQDYALAAQAAQAQVAAARTQRDLAQADWQRFSALKEKGFISGVELDRRRASLQSAQAQLEQAQAQAAAQSNQSSYARLLAPAAGVITAVSAEPGQVVSAGTAVLQLAHDGPRDAVIAVPEGARGQIAVGQAVQVRIWSMAERLSATVREMAASADPVTRTYSVKVGLQGQPQPDLGATAYVSMDSGAAAAQAALKLPTTALWQQQGASMVWRFDPASATVQAQRVEVGSVEGSEVVIASGLEPGMQVVVTGTHVLTQGQKVSVYQPRHPEAAH